MTAYFDCDRAGWCGAAISHVGHVRERNEDCFVIRPDHGLYIVCDGLGGHPGGDIASRVVADAVAEHLCAKASQRTEATIRAACLQARMGLFDRALAEPDLLGMGTTLSLLWFDEDPARAWLGHIGDSRVYGLGPHGLTQLSEDHSVGAEILRATDQNPDDIRHGRAWHQLTRVIGGRDSHEPDIAWINMTDYSACLLRTDGITNMVSDRQIADIFAQRGPRPDGIASRLVDAALAVGGHDNATAIILLKPEAD